MIACAKVIVFLVCFVVFALLVPKHYKIGIFDDFEKLIFRFFDQNLKVNNLATFFPKILGRKVAKLLSLKFSHVFVRVFFLKTIILPAERRIFLKKNNEIKVAKLLTYGGQVIDPAVYIYIYVCVCVFVFVLGLVSYIYIHTFLLLSLSLYLSLSLSFSLLRSRQLSSGAKFRTLQCMYLHRTRGLDENLTISGRMASLALCFGRRYYRASVLRMNLACWCPFASLVSGLLAMLVVVLGLSRASSEF